MLLHSRPARPGYTLLEVLLASAIAVMLMGALYVAIDVQLKHVQISRDIVEQTSLTRVLVGRISNDIRGTLAPQLPSTSSSSSQSSSGGGATGAAASTAASASTKTGAGGASSASASTTTTTSGGITNTVLFNMGVQGDNTHMVLYLSKGPSELYALIGGPPDAVAPEIVSDLRRITYWLVGDSSSPQGLARQEVKIVTSADDMNAVPPDIPDEAKWIIAEEVKSLNFRYWDGSTWQDTWDSTQPSADNSSTNPQGPPRAVEITIGLPAPGSTDTQNLKSYRHVIALPVANGAAQTSTSTTGTTGTSSSGP